MPKFPAPCKPVCRYFSKNSLYRTLFYEAEDDMRVRSLRDANPRYLEPSEDQPALLNRSFLADLLRTKVSC